MIGLAELAGTWTITRTIADHRAGQAGRFDGIARLTPALWGLAYAEEGSLRLGDAPPLQASRSYRWLGGPAGVAVCFADGRAFHDFVPWQNGPGTDHLCGADLYRVQYDWDRWPVWQATWRVLGPAKDYTMTGVYRRV